MKGKEQRWDTFVSYSNLKSPPTGVLLCSLLGRQLKK